VGARKSFPLILNGAPPLIRKKSKKLYKIILRQNLLPSFMRKHQRVLNPMLQPLLQWRKNMAH